LPVYHRPYFFVFVAHVQFYEFFSLLLYAHDQAPTCLLSPTPPRASCLSNVQFSAPCVVHHVVRADRRPMGRGWATMFDNYSLTFPPCSFRLSSSFINTTSIKLTRNTSDSDHFRHAALRVVARSAAVSLTMRDCTTMEQRRTRWRRGKSITMRTKFALRKKQAQRPAT